MADIVAEAKKTAKKGFLSWLQNILGKGVLEAGEEGMKIAAWELGLRGLVSRFPVFNRLFGNVGTQKSTERPFIRSAHQATDLVGRLFAELQDKWHTGKTTTLHTETVKVKNDTGVVTEVKTHFYLTVDDAPSTPVAGRPTSSPHLNEVLKLNSDEVAIINWFLNRKGQYCPAQLEDLWSNAVRMDTRPSNMAEEFNGLTAHLLHFKNAAAAGLIETDILGIPRGDLPVLYETPPEVLDSVELAMDHVFIPILWEQWPDQYAAAHARAAAERMLAAWQEHGDRIRARNARRSRFILWLGGHSRN